MFHLSSLELGCLMVLPPFHDALDVLNFLWVLVLRLVLPFPCRFLKKVFDYEGMSKRNIRNFSI